MYYSCIHIHIHCHSQEKRNIFISTSHLSWFINMTGGMSVDAYANLSACWQKIGVFVTYVWVTWTNFWHFPEDPPVNIHICNFEFKYLLCVCLRSFVWCLHSHTICCGIKRANVKLLTVKNVFSHNKEEYLVKLWLPTFHLSRHRVCILIPFPQCKHPNIVNWS